MIRWIIAASLDLRYLILGAAVALFAYGTLQLGRMPIDVFPEFAPPTVEVQTEAIGLSAEEVESLITLGLEELLSGVPWLESTRSRSVTGLSTITLIFKRGTDIIKARQMVQERLTLEYKLPNVATPPVILQQVSATSRFMMIGISSDTIDPTELSLLARWTIKPRLVGVPGVANVAIWGQRLRQLHVHIHPERLRDARLTQDEIIAAAGDALWLSPLTFLKASATGAGGWIDHHNQRLGIEHSMPIETPEDMAKIPVTPEPELRLGRTVPLGDVAEVTFSHPPLIGDAFVNGRNGLLLVLEKFPSASVPEITHRVEQALRELAQGLPGVKIDTSVFRLASYIEDSVANLIGALLAGAILVVLVAGALRRSWRSALILVVNIPLSLMVAVIALYMAGATLNTMISAGLLVALAVVIDDAIVDVDRVMGRLRDRAAGATIPAIIVETAREMRGPAFYSSLVVIFSVVPIFCMGGVTGAFLEPFAASYLCAVLASMVVALTVTPALCFILFAERTAVAESAVVTALSTRYERRLRRVIAAPRRVFAAAVILAIAGAVAWPFLGESLLPPLREREMVVAWNTPPGTSHAETQRITWRVSRELQAIPGVAAVGAHVGRAVTGDQIVGINSSQIWVSIDPRADYNNTVASVREAIGGYPGIEHSMHTYLRSKVNDVLTGESKAIVVRIYGPRREVRRQQADEVRQAIAGIKGLVDLRVEGEIEEPHVQVKVNLDAAGRADVKPGDVRRASATVFSGVVVGYLFKDQKIFEVVVWGAPESRQSLANLGDVWIDKADRTRVRLRDVADVNVLATPTVIKHERIAPYVDVVANVGGRDLGAVAGDVEERLRKMSFPLEHRAELVGEIVERAKTRQRTAGIITAALIGIFLLLQACFRSWGLALVGFLALVASIAGGVLAASMTGRVSSLGSMVGLLAVLGIAARSGILLIDRYRSLEEHAGMAPGVELVVRGASQRMAAIITSSASTVAALLPILVLGTIPGLEIAHSIAVVVTGGVAASALTSLFVIPPLYLLVRSKAQRAPDLGLSDA
jgi:CzcA family heavy metal efflux pump